MKSFHQNLYHQNLFLFFLYFQQNMSSIHLTSPAHVTCSGAFGMGNSSQCGTGLIADCKLGYTTVCFDFDVIPLIFVKQK